jgi:hypothetical protein
MPEPVKSFTSFARLPAEIQDEIWSYACRFPQVVCMATIYGSMIVEVHPGSRIPPALLHTCQRARELALNVYKYHSVAAGKSFYFNELADMIYFRRRSANWDRTAIAFNQYTIGLRPHLQPL